MNIKDRIVEYLKYKGVSITKAEQDLGWSKSSLLKSNNVSSDKISEFVLFFQDLSSEWLLTGNGEMLKFNTPVIPSPINDEHIKGAIPYYDELAVSAGQQHLATIINQEKPTGWIKIPGVSAEGLFPVVGCSMKPEINPGDVIGLSFINSWDIVDPDKIYMIVTNDDRMIKRLMKDENDQEILWCLSSNYQKFSIRKDEIKFIYRVTFHGRLM